MKPTKGGLDVNEQQLAVIEHVLGNEVTVVAAGAGSGKTHTLVATVLELVARGEEASVDEFALITFTNKAADELRDRLATAIRQRAASDPAWLDHEERLSGTFVGTIHAFCRWALQTFCYESGVPRLATTTMSTRHRTAGVADALEELLATDDAPSLLADVGLAPHEWARLARDVIEMADTIGWPLNEVKRLTDAQSDDPGSGHRRALAGLLVDAEQRYRQTKQVEAVLDTQDLLTNLKGALEGPAGGSVAASIARRYPYVFVDEFQDTDRVQLEILEALQPRLERLVVVGDRKQAIYGWRYAMPSLLAELAARHGSATPLSLSISRRPTRELLRVQNQLFQGMARRHPELGEPLVPSEDAAVLAKPLEPLVWYRYPREAASGAVATHLQRMIGAELPGTERRIEPGDIVILARSNRLAQSLVADVGALVAPAIEVRLDTGASLYTEPASVATLRMLRLVLDYPGSAAVAAALPTPYLRNVDLAERVRELVQYQPREGAPLRDDLEAQYPDVAEKLAVLRRAIRTDTAPQFLARLYDLFAIREYYRSLGDERSVIVLETLRERARELFASEQALTVRIFADWLAMATSTELVDDPVEVDGAERPGFVRVMTIHRAKGLEFPIVIVPGLTGKVDKAGDGHEFFVDDDGLDVRLAGDTGQVAIESGRFEAKRKDERERRIAEEFRLFYVAVTRAQHQAVLVGDNRSPVNGPNSDFYCWRDEVLPTWAALQGLGAVEHRPSMS